MDCRAAATRRRSDLVVVDGVDELLDRQPEVASTVQRVIDDGRRLGVRMIASSGQPPGTLHTGQRGTTVSFTADWIVALRMGTEQASHDVLGRPVAANLPEEPGHAYLKSPTGVVVGPIRMFSAVEVAAALARRLVAADSTANP
jgi:hypothetical protein